MDVSVTRPAGGGGRVAQGKVGVRNSDLQVFVVQELESIAGADKQREGGVTLSIASNGGEADSADIEIYCGWRSGRRVDPNSTSADAQSGPRYGCQSTLPQMTGHLLDHLRHYRDGTENLINFAQTHVVSAT
jgi:hypothetical protein